MRGGEEMDQFEADLGRAMAELRSLPNGGYPEGYRDPEYDGTMSGLAWFNDVVLPARAKAVEQVINGAFADLLPDDCHFEWG